MFNFPYLIEMLTPKKSAQDIPEHMMNLFAERYFRIMDSGNGLSIPDNPMPFEMSRMKQKVEAGAKFVITQPVIRKDPYVDQLMDLHLPVVVEAWMSENIELLYKSVRKEKDQRAEGYDPLENLQNLHDAYPESCVYLSMLRFKQAWQPILSRR